jgi:hypothetical protein
MTDQPCVRDCVYYLIESQKQPGNVLRHFLVFLFHYCQKTITKYKRIFLHSSVSKIGRYIKKHILVIIHS